VGERRADVGVALGTAVVDGVDRLVDAARIGHSSIAIARQSVLVGLGLRALGMLAAAAGLLPPVAGALAQAVMTWPSS
jgi:cation transport ATPase